MATRKVTNKYFFSVEGETEQWYLTRLKKLINDSQDAKYNVSFDCSVQKNPLKRAKSLVVTSGIEVYHFFDYESDDPVHVREFFNTLDNLKKANNIGKQITYKLGYSNLTFDLWLVLHKDDCNKYINNRKDYINNVNKAFDEDFENMDDFKHEKNFKRCLDKLTLLDVVDAIKRAKNIIQTNEKNGCVLNKYKGFKYYKENPSLSIWEVFEKIMKDCGLIDCINKKTT